MGDFILTSKERKVDSPLDWDDETIGKAVINAAIICCEQTDGSFNVNKGMEKTPAIIAGITRDVFYGSAHAFNIKLIDPIDKIKTYCITAQQQSYITSNTKFSAVIDGKRVNTNNVEKFTELMENAEKITEVTIQYGDSK